ncbi:hemerythrin HHE cation binding-containing protein [Glarea lozoyensis ATCC 20868]|uniref:Hemerythrin HHE cation binding-containing protein n=1 Tax=Glarea lozoyensis (strain ATCC 20868 / MF5171) TaxID=1116229 RepID=S3E7U1_GLAL2|nr:hemerythrin HHE cation binding-containing protein [Glarea lozoyensis ATCC 20868]EPE34403.1 hemerythrin HHE cation binding-containing protein [Glarea lozoyensis ATCC 20868]
MALSHNAFIRGFNSIYQQAPRVEAADKKDFVGYCIAWHDCVAQHHHYEETEFFPALDKAAGKLGLMDGAVEQHAQFHDGLEKFKTYLQENGPDFYGTELISIMDSFSHALHEHLKEEPPTIVALSKYNTPETPIDIIGIALAAGKKQVSVGFLFNVLPVYFLNMESKEFEGGMWQAAFPPVSGPVRWVMMKGAPMWNSRAWRFASCDSEGGFKRLEV